MKNWISVLAVIGLFTLESCDDGFAGFGGPVYDREGNLAIDRERIATYLETAEFDSLYRIHDPSGLVVIVQEEGQGSRPFNGNVVYTNYTGMLKDGTVFDTNLPDVAQEHGIFNEDRNYEIFTFFVGQPTNQGGAIEGFSVGFRRLRSGSKAILVIPSPMGYQDNPNIPNIPANSILVFEVDFLGMD
ncbi:70 kDa peptidylprolyl isomerase [Lunatimonas lonarensis]|uniref:Peptidyl-prolyl cis-trans isomerase n=1 Tax=Lunatimonas lonarensis TaxID=1232681 RepID=R7ZTK7_9BACT|nr:FKBP-type peptidyl-prolyl cis-trans isomerase [Lunatimonas lonarensis]EON77373.1 70 kDa peptidylprolyl isomerase [Lunatimonas lonarensis]